MTRGRSPLAIFFGVCGVLVAALFVIALVDLAHDGGKPAFVRSNDLTSAITSGAMLGLVAVAFLRVARAGDRGVERAVPPGPARGRTDRPAAAENVPGAVRARSARRRRRRR